MGFPLFEAWDSGFYSKIGRDSGLKARAGGGIPKIILRITGLLEILCQDYGIEKPYWGSSVWRAKFIFLKIFHDESRGKKEVPLDSCLAFAEDQPLCRQDVFLASAFHPVTDAGVIHTFVLS